MLLTKSELNKYPFVSCEYGIDEKEGMRGVGRGIEGGRRLNIHPHIAQRLLLVTVSRVCISVSVSRKEYVKVLVPSFFAVSPAGLSITPVP